MDPLLIYEWTAEGGASEALLVSWDDGALVVHVEGTTVALPVEALARVMERYGKPVDETVKLEGPTLDLGAHGSLRRIRHRGYYDVIARDFIVWERPEGEPLVEMATAVSAALGHLAHALRSGGG
jgi:hypothetical protein